LNAIEPFSTPLPAWIYDYIIDNSTLSFYLPRFYDWLDFMTGFSIAIKPQWGSEVLLQLE